ncbi:lysylphosphatidylglycerol synthase transmembrane domain-containing protein [Acetomicrobium hydrogeniformans]|nr:lysylphosphatidylglycerol synthase transmembrane domain-containing protein [Acetomicrobium hydrogeniformans]
MSLKRGILYFIGLTICVGVLALYYTSDEETWRLFASAKMSWLSLALIFSIAAWIFDALRIQAIAAIIGENVSLKMALSLVFLNAFGSAVTPFQSGGSPLVIYALYNNGVSVGKGVALTIVRTIITVLVLSVFVPLSMFLVPEAFIDSLTMKGMFLYAVVFVILFCAVIVISVAKSDSIKHIAKVTTIRIGKLNVFNLRIFSAVRFLNRQIDLYVHNMQLLTKSGFLRLSLVCLLTLLYIVFTVSVFPLLAYALGVSVSFMKATILQGLFFFVLYFIPTPGASGVAEGGGVVVYKTLVPLNMAGLLSLGWRFFTHYLAIAIGVAVAIRTIGMNIITKILERKSENESSGSQEDSL